MKKFMSLLLTVVLVLSFTTSSFAKSKDDFGVNQIDPGGGTAIKETLSVIYKPVNTYFYETQITDVYLSPIDAPKFSHDLNGDIFANFGVGMGWIVGGIYINPYIGGILGSINLLSATYTHKIQNDIMALYEQGKWVHVEIVKTTDYTNGTPITTTNMFVYETSTSIQLRPDPIASYVSGPYGQH